MTEKPEKKLGDHLAEIRAARERLLDREIPRGDASTTEGIKALLAVNGGGVVAMLGFMQALIKQEVALKAFRDDGCTAMLFFVIGIISAILIPAFRVLDIDNTLYGDSKHARWEWCLYGAWANSATCFIVACIFVGRGIQSAL